MYSRSIKKHHRSNKIALALNKPIGEFLQEANLISSVQINIALIDKKNNPEIPIGKILVAHGWLKQQTADFFAESWVNTVRQNYRRPLGYYLEQASLLDQAQIKAILLEQNQTWVKFGSVAVLKGWLDPETLNFFLKYLFPESLSEKDFLRKRANIKTTQKRISKINKLISPYQPEIIRYRRSLAQHHKEDNFRWID